jgi:hypothetical protein
MAELPTTGDLLKQGLITDEDVDAAVEAFLGDPTLRVFIFGNACRLNLGAAVKAHRFAVTALRDPEASSGLKRATVATAIMLAQPQRI